MTTRNNKKIINDGFYRLARAVGNITWTDYAKELYDIEKGYEKNHRQFTNCDYVFNVNDASKFWSVYHVLESLELKNDLDIKSYLHIKKSIFYARSIVANYREQIEKEFNGFDIKAFKEIEIMQWREDVA